MTCHDVCRAWKDLLTSDSYWEMAKKLLAKKKKKEENLCSFSQSGNTKEVNRLLSSGVDPNCALTRGCGEETPLYQAVFYGRKDIVKLLLDVGADPLPSVWAYAPLPQFGAKYGRKQQLWHFVPDIVWHGQDGAAVQEDLDDFVVVPVRRQHERRDVRRERSRVRGYRLPTLKVKDRALIMLRLQNMYEYITLRIELKLKCYSTFAGSLLVLVSCCDKTVTNDRQPHGIENQ